MKIQIDDKDLLELINTGKNSKYKQLSKNDKFMKALSRVIGLMRIVERASDLGVYSFLHYEQLKGGIGLSSVRVVNGMVERILFRELNGGIEFIILELNRAHYGNKK